MLRPSLRTTICIERANQAVIDRALAAKPDVVSVWHMGAMSMGILTAISERDVPMVLVVCDDWTIYGPDVDPWMRRFARRPRLGRLARAVTGLPSGLARFRPTDPFCFNSDWIRQRAVARSPFDMPTTTVVYTGIDPADFPIRRDEPRPEWRWRLLCVGRQEPRKGTHVAVRALSRLPERARLEVVGPGDTSYLAQLRDLVAELGLRDRVSFAEAPRSGLRERYADADAFLFPVTWDEPFGLVPVEAMACGTPVVATGTGGSAEFLVDGGMLAGPVMPTR